LALLARGSLQPEVQVDRPRVPPRPSTRRATAARPGPARS
jgi:hypothetical protein